MVLGEDQILGQVKEAHKAAMEEGFSGTWSNSLFQDGSDGGQESQNRNESIGNFSLNSYAGGESGGDVFRQSEG